MIDLESTWRLFLQSLANVKMFCLTYYLIQWYLHLNDLSLNQIKQKYVQIDTLIFQLNKSPYFVTSYFSFHNLYALASIYDHCLSNYLSKADVFSLPVYTCSYFNKTVHDILLRCKDTVWLIIDCCYTTCILPHDQIRVYIVYIKSRSFS